MDREAPSFETAFAALEDCVGVLERGGLTLEEALQRFEVGVRLATECGEILDAAELRITRLLADEHESVEQAEDEPAF